MAFPSPYFGIENTLPYLLMLVLSTCSYATALDPVQGRGFYDISPRDSKQYHIAAQQTYAHRAQ